MDRKPAVDFKRKKPGGERQGRWGWGTPLKMRPPPGVTGVPKLVPVVKPLARLADLVTAGPTAQHAINIEVGYGTGSYSHAFALYGVRRQADARTPGGAGAVAAPIAGYPNFEHLEAEGQRFLPEQLKTMLKALARSSLL